MLTIPLTPRGTVLPLAALSPGAADKLFSPVARRGTFLSELAHIMIRFSFLALGAIVSTPAYAQPHGNGLCEHRRTAVHELSSTVSLN
jgi:hypothetical protein